MTSPFGSSSPSGGPSWDPPGQSPFGPSGNQGTGTSFGSSSVPSANFGNSAAPGGPSTGSVFPASPTSGPKGIVLTATATAVLGVVLGVIAFFAGSATDSIYRILAISGWALSGLVTFVLLGIYTAKDTQRRAESFYVEDGGQTTLYRVAGGIAIVGVVITAIEIALWISKTVGA